VGTIEFSQANGHCKPGSRSRKWSAAPRFSNLTCWIAANEFGYRFEVVGVTSTVGNDIPLWPESGQSKKQKRRKWPEKTIGAKGLRKQVNKKQKKQEENKRLKNVGK
jgi:hypothetical protein